MGEYAKVEAPTNMDTSHDISSEVPEKFRADDGTLDTDKLLSSYQELESKMGQAPTEESEPSSAPEASSPEQDLTVPDKPKVGSDYFQQYKDSYNEETGKLTPEAYEQIINDIPGVTEDLIDQFVAGQRAQGSTYASSMFDITGGEQNYRDMTAWAQDNLSPEETALFNKAVESGDMDSAKVAIKGLHARYTQSKSNPPSRKVETSGFGGTNDTYDSYEEYVADCSKPEYSQSAAFRRQCWDKLQKSNI